MKIGGAILFIMIFLLIIGGGFGVFVLRNTFVVENPSASFDNQIVYLTADDLIVNPQELVDPEPVARFVKVLPNEVGYLNVRSGAGVNNAKVDKVKPGDMLEYSELKNNWYYIALADDKKGWVSGDYVKEVTE
jgi:SH3-like domain-containing protein